MSFNNISKLLLLSCFSVFFLTSCNDPYKKIPENYKSSTESHRDIQKPDQEFESCKAAKAAAKRDAHIPKSQYPYYVEMVPMYEYNEPIYINNRMIYGRQYVYENYYGEKLIIQNHPIGHFDNDFRPHLHVRPYDNTRTGKVEGTSAHYFYETTTECDPES